MRFSDTDRVIVYYGYDLNGESHHIQVDWTSKGSYESASFYDDGWSEVDEINLTVKSVGEYPLDKSIVEMLFSCEDVVNNLLSEHMDVSLINEIQVDESDFCEARSIIDDIKDEVAA